jgi:hypothetical protein
MYMHCIVTYGPRRKYPQQSKVTLGITGCLSQEPTWTGSFGTSIMLSLLLCRLLLNLNYNNDVIMSRHQIKCYIILIPLISMESLLFSLSLR